jgi:hypothetical protein
VIQRRAFVGTSAHDSVGSATAQNATYRRAIDCADCHERYRRARWNVARIVQKCLARATRQLLSKIGKLATFAFTLPPGKFATGIGYAPARARGHIEHGARQYCWECLAEATPDPGDDPRAQPLVHGETLMVVDEDRVHLLRDEEMLAALGYEPVGFTPPNEVVVACRKDPQRFHALMIGHLGPAKTALDLAAALHSTVPGANRGRDGVGQRDRR